MPAPDHGTYVPVKHLPWHGNGTELLPQSDIQTNLPFIIGIGHFGDCQFIFYGLPLWIHLGRVLRGQVRQKKDHSNRGFLADGHVFILLHSKLPCLTVLCQVFERLGLRVHLGDRLHLHSRNPAPIIQGQRDNPHQLQRSLRKAVRSGTGLSVHQGPPARQQLEDHGPLRHHAYHPLSSSQLNHSRVSSNFVFAWTPLRWVCCGEPNDNFK